MKKIWWLWLPVAFLGLQIVLELTLPAATLARLHTENSPHELLQFAAIAGAFVVALMALLKPGIRAQKGLAAWIALAAVCSLYVAGEEISWGQHFMAWTTPEFWAAVNDQQETNLHNTTSWLDQKPRLLLELGVITGGLIIPLLMKYRPQLVPQKFALIYPPSYLAAIALIALGVKLVDSFTGLFERGSEVEELYLYYFILLYLVALKKRALTSERPS